ncbi:MAG: hypothetical protein NT033_08220 [Candidatus Omnitrophica bacterium]|nr:hypothetical protein [Candidatus Omnitrophota bacterium]
MRQYCVGKRVVKAVDLASGGEGHFAQGLKRVFSQFGIEAEVLSVDNCVDREARDPRRVMYADATRLNELQALGIKPDSQDFVFVNNTMCPSLITSGLAILKPGGSLWVTFNIRDGEYMKQEAFKSIGALSQTQKVFSFEPRLIHKPIDYPIANRGEYTALSEMLMVRKMGIHEAEGFFIFPRKKALSLLRPLRNSEKGFACLPWLVGAKSATAAAFLITTILIIMGCCGVILVLACLPWLVGAKLPAVACVSLAMTIGQRYPVIFEELSRHELKIEQLNRILNDAVIASGSAGRFSVDDGSWRARGRIQIDWSQPSGRSLYVWRGPARSYLPETHYPNRVRHIIADRNLHSIFTMLLSEGQTPFLPDDVRNAIRTELLKIFPLAFTSRPSGRGRSIAVIVALLSLGLNLLAQAPTNTSQDIITTPPQPSEQDLMREDNVSKGLEAFLAEAEQRLIKEGDPAISAVIAFRDFAQERLGFIYDVPELHAAVLVRNVDDGSERLSVKLLVNVVSFEKLLALSKTNSIYKELLSAIIIKEGAMLEDIGKNPEFYAAAQWVEQEYAGYRAALDYIERRHVSYEELNGLPGGQHLATMLSSRLRFDAKEAELWIRIDILLHDFAVTLQKVKKAVMAILDEEAGGVYDVKTSLKLTSFLGDPRYIGREATSPLVPWLVGSGVVLVALALAYKKLFKASVADSALRESCIVRYYQEKDSQIADNLVNNVQPGEYQQKFKPLQGEEITLKAPAFQGVVLEREIPVNNREVPLVKLPYRFKDGTIIYHVPEDGRGTTTLAKVLAQAKDLTKIWIGAEEDIDLFPELKVAIITQGSNKVFTVTFAGETKLIVRDTKWYTWLARGFMLQPPAIVFKEGAIEIGGVHIRFENEPEAIRVFKRQFVRCMAVQKKPSTPTAVPLPAPAPATVAPEAKANVPSLSNVTQIKLIKPADKKSWNARCKIEGKSQEVELELNRTNIAMLQANKNFKTGITVSMNMANTVLVILDARVEPNKRREYSVTSEAEISQAEADLSACLNKADVVPSKPVAPAKSNVPTNPVVPPKPAAAQWMQVLFHKSQAQAPTEINSALFYAIKEVFNLEISNHHGSPCMRLALDPKDAHSPQMEIILLQRHLYVGFKEDDYIKFGASTSISLLSGTNLEQAAYSGQPLLGVVKTQEGELRFVVAKGFLELASKPNFHNRFSRILCIAEDFNPEYRLFWPYSREETLLRQVAQNCKAWWQRAMIGDTITLTPEAFFKKTPRYGMLYGSGNNFIRFEPEEAELKSEALTAPYIFKKPAGLAGWALNSESKMCAIYDQRSGFNPPQENGLLNFITLAEYLKSRQEFTEIAFLAPAISDSAAADGAVTAEEKEILVKGMKVLRTLNKRSPEIDSVFYLICEILRLPLAQGVRGDKFERLEVKIVEEIRLPSGRQDIRGFWYIDPAGAITIYVRQDQKLCAITRHEIGALCGLPHSINLLLEGFSEANTRAFLRRMEKAKRSGKVSDADYEIYRKAARGVPQPLSDDWARPKTTPTPEKKASRSGWWEVIKLVVFGLVSVTLIGVIIDTPACVLIVAGLVSVIVVLLPYAAVLSYRLFKRIFFHQPFSFKLTRRWLIRLVMIGIAIVMLPYSYLKYGYDMAWSHALELPRPLPGIEMKADVLQTQDLPTLWRNNQLNTFFNNLRQDKVLVYRLFAQMDPEQIQEFAKYFSVIKPGIRQQILETVYKQLKDDSLILSNGRAMKIAFANNRYNGLSLQTKRAQYNFSYVCAMLNRIVPRGANDIPEGPLYLQAMPEKPFVPVLTLPLTRQESIETTVNMFVRQIGLMKDQGYRVVMPDPSNVNVSELAGLIGYEEFYNPMESTYLEDNQAGKLLGWVLEVTDPANPGAHRVTDYEMLQKATELHKDEATKTINLLQVVATIGHYYKAMARSPSIILGAPMIRFDEDGVDFIWNHHDPSLFSWAIDDGVKPLSVDDQGRPVYFWRKVLADGSDYIPQGQRTGILRPDTSHCFYHAWNVLLTSFYVELKTFSAIEQDKLAHPARYAHTRWGLIKRLYGVMTHPKGRFDNEDVVSLPVLLKAAQAAELDNFGWKFRSFSLHQDKNMNRSEDPFAQAGRRMAKTFARSGLISFEPGLKTTILDNPNLRSIEGGAIGFEDHVARLNQQWDGLMARGADHNSAEFWKVLVGFEQVRQLQEAFLTLGKITEPIAPSTIKTRTSLAEYLNALREDSEVSPAVIRRAVNVITEPEFTIDKITSGYVQKALVSHPYINIRIHLAESMRALPEILAVLAQDKEQEVRFGVVQNENIGIDTLRLMQTDKYRFVADAARFQDPMAPLLDVVRLYKKYHGSQDFSVMGCQMQSFIDVYYGRKPDFIMTMIFGIFNWQKDKTRPAEARPSVISLLKELEPLVRKYSSMKLSYEHYRFLRQTGDVEGDLKTLQEFLEGWEKNGVSIPRYRVLDIPVEPMPALPVPKKSASLKRFVNPLLIVSLVILVLFLWGNYRGRLG